jgi:hypothetical protein
MTRLRSISLVLLVFASAVGCGKKIGDECGNNVDCSIAGDRFCDTAPVGGYCTVEGCDVGTCPDEAVCVRFYTALLTRPCTYDAASPRGDCAPDERCLCDQTSGDACAGTAHCAPENSERRWCMKTCEDSGDCRGGYVCRSTGTFGAEPVPSFQHPKGEPATFCVSSGINTL